MAAAIGYLLLAALIIYIVYLIVVYVILPGLAIGIGVSITVGALIGGGHAVYNYCAAFAENVKREKV
jgi:hypothetical protein